MACLTTLKCIKHRFLKMDKQDFVWIDENLRSEHFTCCVDESESSLSWMFLLKDLDRKCPVKSFSFRMEEKG